MNDLKNHKQYWTSKEENDLIFELTNNNTISVIASKHNRSENAIKLRIASLIQKELDKGTPRKKIISSLNITDEMMMNLLDFSKRFSSSTSSKSSPSIDNSGSSLILEKLNALDSRFATIEKYVKLIYKKISK